MPRLDGTGPVNMGPMTGRGLGYCGGHRSSGYFKRRGVGLDSRRCFGGRRFSGYDRTPNAHKLSPEEEREILLREKEILEAELETIERELED